MTKIPLEMISDETEIRFRDCLSVRYIQSSALLCRMGYAIEREFEEIGGVPEEDVVRHEAFILNSILSSVAFLESAVNELYADAIDGAFLQLDRATETLFCSIARGWHNEKNFDRAPLLMKYQKILSLAGGQPFSDSDPAFTNVKNLIALRNFFLHYRKEWVNPVKAGGAARGQAALSEAERFGRILSRAFKENPLAHKNQPFFPDRCLGHGCAEWGVINSLIITDTFFSRIGTLSPYENIRDDLATR